jgi:hypothetical protein
METQLARRVRERMPMRELFMALTNEPHPTRPGLSTGARQFVLLTGDEHFAFGLDAMLDGLSRFVERRD